MDLRSSSASGSGGRVEAVHRSPRHAMAKQRQERIALLAGIGVEGDAHAGATVRHRSRVRRDATQPNLRQVHLLGAELHEELARAGFDVAPGRMGENVTTAGVPLLDLPTGTVVRLGPDAVVELTGLRNPCRQLDGIAPGLMEALLERDEAGAVVRRRAGVMAVVRTAGVVHPGDPVVVEVPPGPRRPLEPV